MFLFKWKDDFVVWNDIQYFNFYKQFHPRIPVSYIWAPTLMLDNAASEVQYYKLRNDSTVEVDSDGTVTARLIAKFTSNCELNVLKYDFLMCSVIYFTLLLSDVCRINLLINPQRD